MASSSDYCRSILRVSVAQICQNLGWNATQTSTLELLTDVLERYLLELGKVSHRYCEQCKYAYPLAVFCPHLHVCAHLQTGACR